MNTNQRRLELACSKAHQPRVGKLYKYTDDNQCMDCSYGPYIQEPRDPRGGCSAAGDHP